MWYRISKADMIKYEKSEMVYEKLLRTTKSLQMLMANYPTCYIKKLPEQTHLDTYKCYVAESLDDLSVTYYNHLHNSKDVLSMMHLNIEALECFPSWENYNLFKLHDEVSRLYGDE